MLEGFACDLHFSDLLLAGGIGAQRDFRVPHGLRDETGSTVHLTRAAGSLATGVLLCR